jgi:hypothetical protein
MSHKTLIKCEIGIHDENYLEAAIKEFGANIEIVRNARPVGWGGDKNMDICEYVIKIPGTKYSLGLKKNPLTGTFDLIYDEFSGEIEAVFGKGCYKLVNNVKALSAARELGMSGFTIIENETLTNGHRRMVAVMY